MTGTPGQMVTAALQYARSGWSVFPCIPNGKTPITAHGFKNATTNREIIKQWWLQNPIANIGIATGGISGLVVADVDVKNGQCGKESLEQLQRECGTLLTRSAKSPSGGWHFYFQHPGGKVANRAGLLPGLDIRGDGGYILAPPSVTEAGAYQWSIKEDPAPIPDGLLKLLNGKSKGNGKASPFKREIVVNGVPEGQRDDVLFRYVCSLKSRNTLRQEAEVLVREAAANCSPPCPRDVAFEKVRRVYDDPEYRKSGDATALILERDNPIGSAREFVRRRYSQAEERVLHHRSGDFYSWSGTHYRSIDERAIRSEVWRFLEDAQAIDKDGNLIPFNPNRRPVTDAIDALKAVAHLDRHREPPFWIGGRDGPEPREIMPCANGLLHLPSETLYPAAPHFFGLNALPFAYDPDADRPERWLHFLHEDLWPGDSESVSTLQELFGLMLVPDTTQQKIFFLVGPKRAGKGTIARILTALLGRDNVAGPTLASLGQNFGLSPLIGKTAAIISDARLGSRADQAVITERLLSISGEDMLTVDRKYRDPWTGQFAVRFLVLTNELSRISDASCALASRFVVLVLGNTFYGREDPGLTGRLMQELSGIVNWSIEGWRRLRERGYFVQPTSSQEAISELEELGSPMGAFVKQKCVIGPEHSVPIDGLFLNWQNWCDDQGRSHAGTKQTFGRDLRAVVPGLRVTQPRSANQHRIYQGIDLKGDTRCRALYV